MADGHHGGERCRLRSESMKATAIEALVPP